MVVLVDIWNFYSHFVIMHRLLKEYKVAQSSVKGLAEMLAEAEAESGHNGASRTAVNAEHSRRPLIGR